VRERGYCSIATRTLGRRGRQDPQAVLAREDGMRLARTVAAYSGKSACGWPCLTKSADPSSRKTWSVRFAATKGRTRPSSSAHISIPGNWHWRTGQRCNAALVIEIINILIIDDGSSRRSSYARQLHTHSRARNQSHGAPTAAHCPLRALSGEEQGTVGSFEYVKAHRAELDKNPRDDHL